MDKKTNKSNLITPEKPPMPTTSSYPTPKKPPMPPIEGYLIEKELHQLMLYEEALIETLEEEARDQKEFDEINKRLEKEARKEQAHDELLWLEFEKNMVKVFRKDTVPGSLSGSG
nr:hypothetical protein [Tanacetum cinerariifolium]